MIEELKKRIKTLPPLPESFHKIRMVCESDGGIDEVAKAIESDPMVVADILKTANSPLYGFNRQIKTVLQAVSLFGKTMTKSLVMSSTIKGLLKIDVKPYGKTPEQFVELSNLQGLIAKNWFKQEAPKSMEDLFLCALLQDTGKIVLADEVIRRDEVLCFKSDVNNGISIDEAEIIHFGTTSIMLTADIFDHWGFEQNMVNSIRHSNDPQNSPDEYKQIAWALYIIRILINYKEPFSEISVQKALNLASENGFDADILDSVISDIKSKF